MASVKQVKLGSQGLEVSQQGLGCMGMTAVYGPAKPVKEMVELIRHAVDLGVTMLDTSDVYGPHTNEEIVGKAVKGIREKVQIATKFGIAYTEKGVESKGNPEYVQDCVNGSLKRLDVDYIDLLYYHRMDPTVPIEVTIGEMKKYVDAGKVKYIGVSEASSSEIRRAHAVHPLTAVQLEWSLWSRDIEEDVVPTCRELGIGIVSYSPLGKGFFAGVKQAELTDDDYRKMVPRNSNESNQKFFQQLLEIAKKHKKTPGQLALAWVQSRGTDVVTIPGTTKAKNLEENIGALNMKLSKAECDEIETAVPVADVSGDRYDSYSMTATWRHVNTPPLSSWNR